jgi:endonuclease/exonuclease/phosphatase family metal-dependent hydrolase
MKSSRGAATVCLLLCAAVVASAAPGAADRDRPTCRTVVAPSGAPSTVKLEWRLPQDDHDRSVAEACATVGPGVHLEASTTAPMPISTVAVVSWNMHVGGGDLHALLQALRSGALTDGEVPTHVVVLLQEAFRRGESVPASVPERAPIPKRIDPRGPDGMRDEIVTIAQAERLHLTYLPSMRNGRGRGDAVEDRGNAILATLPIDDVLGIELPMTRQRRVALAATLHARTPSGDPWRLRVVSAHLNASSSADHWWLSTAAVRERQARYLVEALHGDLPTIVGADLNTWAGSVREPAARILSSAFPTSAGDSRLSLRDWRRLDHVFLRVPAEWRVVTSAAAPRFGSDHRPIVIRLQAASVPASRRIAPPVSSLPTLPPS